MFLGLYMKLKCLLERVDFVPMIKTNATYWRSPETLRKDSLLDVEEQIGYQLLAMYPSAFQVYNEPEKRRKKAVESDMLSHTNFEASPA